MEVKQAGFGDDLSAVCAVLRQLRPAYTEEELRLQVERQMQEGYQVAWVEEDGKVLCAAGYVFGTKLAWGRHLYVDDLVTDDAWRSRGAGALMIRWLKEQAIAKGCAQLHLDSGLQRAAAHRFYLREGFRIASHHFSLTDLRADDPQA